MRKLFAVACLVLGVPLFAVDRFISTTGSDANSPCTINPCLTIQVAVNAAAAGDRIIVAGGTYNQTVNVNKALILRGAQAGVDARTRNTPASESTISNTNTPFNITASNVVIDGFTISGETNPNTFGFGIVIGAGTSGTQILDDIIENNIAGISLANNSAVSQTVIQFNVIRNNNNAGPISGTGIYSDQFTAGGTLTDVLVDENAFVNNSNGDIVLVSTDGTKPASFVTIQGNSHSGSGNAMVLGVAQDVLIRQNRISNTAGSSIVVSPPSSGIVIASNVLTGGATRGIRATDITGAGGPIANLAIRHNSITNFGADGIDIDPAVVLSVVNAENNWFGCNEGPGQPGCETVTGSVDADPWLVLTVTASPSSVVVDGTSAIDGALTFNSDGGEPLILELVKDGIPISFTSTGGTISPLTAGTSAGHAGTTFTAQNTSGSGSASATLDNETVTAPITITAAPTVTTLGVVPNPSTFGQTVTYTADVVSITPGTPTGTVMFTIDGITGGPVTLTPVPGSSRATFSTSALSVGSHTVLATYSGDSRFAPSTSSTVTQLVNVAPTTTTVTSSQNPSVTGNSVTFTATVTSGVAGAITGTVTFTVDGVAAATVALGGGGQATFSTSPLTAGNHSVVATYMGDANYDTSTSPPVTQLVQAPGAVPALSMLMLMLLGAVLVLAGLAFLR